MLDKNRSRLLQDAPVARSPSGAVPAGMTPIPVATPENAVDFRSIQTWVFDLDNTLYPPHSDLWPKIDHRITVYISDLFGIDGLSARALQKHYYKHHGTSLNGLLIEHGDRVDAARFLDFVHDIDRSTLLVDDRLAGAIERLPGRRLVFTNGSRGHAEKTMLALGIAHLFDDVFDIVSGGYRPKPDPATYDLFLSEHGVDPARAVMFEDIAHNLVAPKALGMGTVLVVPRSGSEDHREAWEKTHVAPPYVDHVTDDLAGFLDNIARNLACQPSRRLTSTP